MGGFLHGRMEKVAVFFLKTMQFHDFDSIVEDPCCVEDKINIQNSLKVHRGGFLGNGWDKGSGGNTLVNTFLVGAPGGDNRIVGINYFSAFPCQSYGRSKIGLWGVPPFFLNSM